ncbi:hypothetical protein [Planctomycetes bacterium K23_9]|uniref:PspA/IM30 family protein n=1 Tax=Stieleria marina TaxID=1930275 RepID=A0A517NZJ2_9BACT|nr:hypothetical protein K239x_45420 [Planctomycetes bacterium K23_9]
MSESNVRDIESLAAFHAGLLKLSDNWDAVLQELRMAIHRADQYFADDRPRYWRRQIELAERELNEAKDNLSQKRAAVRASDRPAATEAVNRVNQAKRRLDLCREKSRLAKAIAVEISHECDVVLGPLADVSEHCDVLLPKAAGELKTLIEHLRRYAEKSEPPSEQG